jgi:preprotein translocase subunit YajC
MNFSSVAALIAFAPPPPPGHQPNPTGQLLQMLGTFMILGLMFYFVLIRPQQRKAREHNAVLKSLKPGDKVLTSGGILGVVVGVKEKSVSIRSADTKLELLKSAVSEIVEKAAGSSSTES